MKPSSELVWWLSPWVVFGVSALVLPERYTVMGVVAYLLRNRTRWGWSAALAMGAVAAAVASELIDATAAQRGELLNATSGFAGLCIAVLMAYALARVTLIPAVSRSFAVSSAYRLR